MTDCIRLTEVCCTTSTIYICNTIFRFENILVTAIYQSSKTCPSSFIARLQFVVRTRRLTAFGTTGRPKTELIDLSLRSSAQLMSIYITKGFTSKSSTLKGATTKTPQKGGEIDYVYSFHTQPIPSDAHYCDISNARLSMMTMQILHDHSRPMETSLGSPWKTGCVLYQCSHCKHITTRS